MTVDVTLQCKCQKNDKFNVAWIENQYIAKITTPFWSNLSNRFTMYLRCRVVIVRRMFVDVEIIDILFVLA